MRGWEGVLLKWHTAFSNWRTIFLFKSIVSCEKRKTVPASFRHNPMQITICFNTLISYTSMDIQLNKLTLKRECLRHFFDIWEAQHHLLILYLKSRSTMNVKSFILDKCIAMSAQYWKLQCFSFSSLVIIYPKQMVDAYTVIHSESKKRKKRKQQLWDCIRKNIPLRLVCLDYENGLK